MVHPAAKRVEQRVGASVITSDVQAAKVRRTRQNIDLLMAVDPAGGSLCVVQLDSVQLLATVGDPLVPQALAPTGIVRSACFDRSGKYLLTGGDDKTVRAWDVASRAVIGSWTHGKKIGCVAFAPAGPAGETLGLWADKFGEVFAIDVLHPDTPPVLKLGHLSPVSNISFTPCGGFLVTSDREGHVRASVWPHTDIIERYYLTHVSPLQIVLPLATQPLLLTATASGELSSHMSISISISIYLSIHLAICI